MELEVEATFSGGGGGGRRSHMGCGDGVADHRGITVVIHYSLMKTPDFGYRPRKADDRVGHFLNATKDYAVTDADSNFVRLINRWRLEKANPASKLSPPKKQIVWYVEDTVPIEYRPYVEEGIREWNKAFEKIGFKDAIAVRWEESGRDDFDPEDTNYCTFRWITSDNGYAMSCLRANPLTGEMIDGDVVFDASFIRYWKQEYALLVGSTTAQDGQAADRAAGHRRGDQPDPGLEDGIRPAQRPCALGYRCTRQKPRPNGRRGRPRRSKLPLAGNSRRTWREAAAASASISLACNAISAWPRSPWPNRRRPAAGRKERRKERRQRHQGRKEKAPAQG